MRLKDKVAVITGAGRGIGRAVAIAFAKEGADVVIGELDVEPAEEVVREILSLGRRAIPIKVDVSIKDEVENMFKIAIEEFGRVDILVNNAGIVKPAMLHKMTDEQWDAVINVHLKGTYNCIRAIAGHMIERKSGKIINITSAAGLVGTVGQINYSAAKAGITGITKSAARELARFGINVNCIAPAAETRMTEGLFKDPKLKEQTLARVPLGRFAKPEEIAPTFVFLASGDADFITGQIICVDGGAVM